MTGNEKKNESKKALTVFTAVSNLLAFGIFTKQEADHYRAKIKERFKNIFQ